MNNTWVTDCVRDSIRLYNENDTELVSIYANRLAVDVFRKLGKIEREEARWATFEYGGRVLAEAIQDTYPHHWN